MRCSPQGSRRRCTIAITDVTPSTMQSTIDVRWWVTISASESTAAIVSQPTCSRSEASRCSTCGERDQHPDQQGQAERLVRVLAVEEHEAGRAGVDQRSEAARARRLEEELGEHVDADHVQDEARADDQHADVPDREAGEAREDVRQRVQPGVAAGDRDERVGLEQQPRLVQQLGLAPVRELVGVDRTARVAQHLRQEEEERGHHQQQDLLVALQAAAPEPVGGREHEHEHARPEQGELVRAARVRVGPRVGIRHEERAEQQAEPRRDLREQVAVDRRQRHALAGPAVRPGAPHRGLRGRSAAGLHGEAGCDRSHPSKRSRRSEHRQGRSRARRQQGDDARAQTAAPCSTRPRRSSSAMTSAALSAGVRPSVSTRSSGASGSS